MKISITKDDIKYARNHQEDPCRNPVAMAIRQAVGIATSAGPGVAVIDYATPWQTEVWLPEEIIDWLEQWNEGKMVKPIEFELEFELEFDLNVHETRRAGRK